MEKLIDLIRKKFWPIIVIISTLFGLLGGYSFFFEKNRTSLEYQIINHVSALDIKENLSELDVIYKGKSLLDTKENIQVFTIRLINNGNVTIKENDYSSNKFGIEIKNATLIEKVIISPNNNKYLNENSNITFKQDKLIIPKLILEPNEKIEFKVYLLSKTNQNVLMIPFGKVAGIKEEIKITEGTSINNNVYVDAVKGDFTTQGIRLLFYSFSFIIMIIFFVSIIDKIYEFIGVDRLYRKNVIKKFKKKYNFQDVDNKIFNAYIDNSFFLSDVNLSFLDKTEYDLLEDYKVACKNLEDNPDISLIVKDQLIKIKVQTNKLINLEILYYVEDKFIFNNNNKEIFRNFINFLRTNKKTKNQIDTSEYLSNVLGKVRD